MAVRHEADIAPYPAGYAGNSPAVGLRHTTATATAGGQKPVLCRLAGQPERQRGQGAGTWCQGLSTVAHFMR